MYGCAKGLVVWYCLAVREKAGGLHGGRALGGALAVGGWRGAARVQGGLRVIRAKTAKGATEGRIAEKRFRVIRVKTAVLRKGGHKRKKVPGASSREGTGGTLWTHGLVDSVGGACAGDRTCMCRPRSCRGRCTSPGRSRRCLCRSGRPSSQYLCTWARRPPQHQLSQMGGRRGDKKEGATRIHYSNVPDPRNNESRIRTRCKTGGIWRAGMTGWAGGLAGGKEGRKGVGIRWDGGWRCASRLQGGFRVIRGRTAVLRKGGHKRKKVLGGWPCPSKVGILIRYSTHM
jgi:hypothetical protein